MTGKHTAKHYEVGAAAEGLGDITGLRAAAVRADAGA